MTVDWAEFFAQATRLSRYINVWNALREKLIAARDRAPLFDSARSGRTLEFGFAEMWRRHCPGKEPRPIDIPKVYGRAASLSLTQG